MEPIRNCDLIFIDHRRKEGVFQMQLSSTSYYWLNMIEAQVRMRCTSKITQRLVVVPLFQILERDLYQIPDIEDSRFQAMTGVP